MRTPSANSSRCTGKPVSGTLQGYLCRGVRTRLSLGSRADTRDGSARSLHGGFTVACIDALTDAVPGSVGGLVETRLAHAAQAFAVLHQLDGALHELLVAVSHDA